MVLLQHTQHVLHTLLVINIVLPTLVVGLRFWSRALSPRGTLSQTSARFWWDDWTILVAWIFNTALCGVGLKMLDVGLGLHAQDINPQDYSTFLRMLWVADYMFICGSSIARSSALFFYVRIFGVLESWYQYILWLVHAINMVWLVVLILVSSLQCAPTERAWKPDLPGTCWDKHLIMLGGASSSLVIDVLILILPLPILWGLSMKLLRKIQITGVFVCGYLVVIVSVGRIVALVQVGSALEADLPYRFVTPVFWLGSETAISILSVSLPSMLFLAQRVRKQGIRSLITTRSLHIATNTVDSRMTMDKRHLYTGAQVDLTRISLDFPGFPDILTATTAEIPLQTTILAQCYHNVWGEEIEADDSRREHFGNEVVISSVRGSPFLPNTPNGSINVSFTTDVVISPPECHSASPNRNSID